MSLVCLKIGVDITAEAVAEVMSTQTGVRAISLFDLNLNGQIFPDPTAEQKVVTAADLSKLDPAEIFMASVAADHPALPRF